jgi:single-stranded DNA-binding protein
MYENTVKLTGYVGNVKLHQKDDKITCASVSLATQKSYQDKDGNWVNGDTLWHNLMIFGKQIDLFKDRENGAPLISKGNLISVCGELQYSTRESEGGEKHTTCRINVNRIVRLIDSKTQEAIDHLPAA